jgi:hypothetical protein
MRRVFKTKTKTGAIRLARLEMTFMDAAIRANRAISGKMPDFKPLR